MRRSPSLGLAIVTLMAVPDPAFAMSASFRWCGSSPEFQLRDVPSGTKQLDLRMTDLAVPSFRHGGGVVAYAGQKTIPCGALGGGFVGPSPPKPQIHTYRFTIKALDAAGKVLAETSAERKFPE
jgi:phosphatidylethanolamine-binding protein (PEBP) family uncharacterized protein